jgi:hypothetical protein
MSQELLAESQQLSIKMDEIAKLVMQSRNPQALIQTTLKPLIKNVLSNLNPVILKEYKESAIKEVNKVTFIYGIILIIVYGLFALIGGWIIRKFFMSKTYASNINKYTALIGGFIALIIMINLFIAVRGIIHTISKQIGI